MSSIEDLLGAGAIFSKLRGTRSPDEVVDRGFARDVDLAAALDVTTTVPVLRGGMFTAR